jgi:hypothetical protein
MLELGVFSGVVAAEWTVSLSVLVCGSRSFQ